MEFPKVGRIKLGPDAYRELVQQVLERDEWRCRRCSSRSNLSVHHIIKRSKVRLDASWNLCTLCNECHELVERHKIEITGNADELLFISSPV